MGLTHKYRPTTFSDLIGDFSHVEKELDNLQGNHVFLLDGPSGSGKSSLAEIIADYLGADGFDFKAINASDATGVDDMRDILETIDYAPHGKVRVICFDECHRLSAAAWSLLRTPTENVAPYNYFVFATSNAKKIPIDNRGRMFVVNFPPISENLLYNHLKYVTKLEGILVESEVLAAISEVAGGSVRKALLDMESILHLPSEKQLEAVRKLGTDDDPEVINLARILYGSGHWAEISGLLKRLKEIGTEAETIRRTLLSYGSSMLLNGNPKGSISKYFLGDTFTDGFPAVVLMCYKAKHNKEV